VAQSKKSKKSAKSATSAKKLKTKKPKAKTAATLKKTAAAKASQGKKPTAKKATAHQPTAQKANVKGATKSLAAKSTTTMKPLLAMFMTPLDQRVVVQVDEVADQTAGGIILVGDAAGKPQKGKVIAVGRGHMNKKGKVKPLDVAIGDHVLYTQYAGTAVDWQGHNLLILREDEILGVLT
jgi:chaperonin GroES